MGVPLSPDCRWHNLDIAGEEGSSSAAQLVAQLLGFSPPFYPPGHCPHWRCVVGSMNSICPQCLQHKLQFRIKVLPGRVLGGSTACPGYHLLLLVEVFRNQKSVVFVSTSWLRHKYEPEYLNLLWNARSILRRGITNNHTCFVHHVSKHTFEHHSLLSY